MATFTNVATLSYNGNTTRSNVVTGELQEVLTAAKTAVRGVYAAGDDITYVVSLVNAGGAAFSGLVIADDLGAYTSAGGTLYPLQYVAGSILYYVNGVLQAAPAVDVGTTLTFTGITVPAGGNAMLVYETRVNAYAPLDTGFTVINRVSITGTGLPGAITATETIRSLEAAQLAISKSLSPAVVTENGRLTYTFTIQNTGNTAADASDSVTLTDTFDPALRDLTVTFNGTTLTAPTDYSYDQVTGTFTTVAGRLTVPAATYTQDTTGRWVVTPGVSTLVVSGTI